MKRSLIALATLLSAYTLSSGCLSDWDVDGMYEPSWEPSDPAGAPQELGDPHEREVAFNGVLLAGRQLALLETLESYHQVRLPDGGYWYDHVSGAFGIEGGPALALIQPNLDLGGPLQSGVSNGWTGVFVNGRQLPGSERDYLQHVVGGWIAPGRYWLLHDGTWGYEGGPPQGNLVAAARQSAPQQRGSLLSGSFLTGTFVNAAGAASRDGSSVTW